MTTTPGITGIRCEARELDGKRQCGLESGHGGPHTWAAPERDMMITLTPLQGVAMTGVCPGCQATITQQIQIQIAAHLQNGGEMQGSCPNCGQRSRIVRRRLLDTGPSVAPARLAPGPARNGKGHAHLTLAKR